MNRPRLLDLFCGEGGAGAGYAAAGYDVTGVDLADHSRRYPFRFVRGDALEYVAAHSHRFDFIHASPPCQRYSAMSISRPGLARTYPDLVEPTRAALLLAGLPWVIENVPRAPVRPDLMLCGQMVGLALYRHRIFELGPGLMVWQPDHPPHTVKGGRAGHWRPGEIVSVSGTCAPIKLARQAMGIDWTTRRGLAEAIPPAYTRYIGDHLIGQAAA